MLSPFDDAMWHLHDNRLSCKYLDKTACLVMPLLNQDHHQQNPVPQPLPLASRLRIRTTDAGHPNDRAGGEEAIQRLADAGLLNKGMSCRNMVRKPLAALNP